MYELINTNYIVTSPVFKMLNNPLLTGIILHVLSLFSIPIIVWLFCRIYAYVLILYTCVLLFTVLPVFISQNCRPNNSHLHSCTTPHTK
jgi:hypothetical protein